MKTVTQRYNICVGRNYTNGQNEQKTEWIIIGNAMQMDDGKIHLNINCTPTFAWDGRATLFIKEQQTQPIQQPTTNHYATLETERNGLPF